MLFNYIYDKDISCQPLLGYFVQKPPGRVIPKTLKKVHDTFLFNTQHYKVWIKGKVEPSREMSRAFPYTSV